MTNAKTHIAAHPGHLYWRYSLCPHLGSKVLLLTVGGICVVGSWYGKYAESFIAWCPLPKVGPAPFNIHEAPLWQRLVYAFNLIFNPTKELQ